MPNRINADFASIDHKTSVAICDGIGERLRDIMKPTLAELPPRIQDLMAQFQQIDAADAPSIVPAFDSAFSGR